MEPEELADSLKRLVAWAEQHAPKPEPAVRRRLREHLGGDPAELPIISRDLAAWDRPNFQVAVDAWSAGREVDVLGLPVVRGYRAGLAELVRTSDWGPGLELGAVQHVTVPLGEHESIAWCSPASGSLGTTRGRWSRCSRAVTTVWARAWRSRSWPATASGVSACSPSSGS